MSGYELAERRQSSLAGSGPRSTSALKALPRSVGRCLCDGASPTSSARDDHSRRSLRSWSRSRSHCGRAAGLRLREDGRFQLVPVGIRWGRSAGFGPLHTFGMGSKFDPLQYGDGSDSDAEHEDTQQELEPSVTTSAKPKVRNRAPSSSRLTMGIRDKHSGGFASVACSEKDGQSSSQEGRLRSS